MNETLDYYKRSYNITSDTVKDGSLELTSGDKVTHFINGNPDITEALVFLGKDHCDSLVFIREKTGQVIVCDDAEDLFRK